MKFFKIIADYVQQAEKLYGANTGNTKKEFVLNSINSLVDIPVLPEALEKRILEILIDLAVYIFNTYVWKK
jgi:hypothetical protein